MRPPASIFRGDDDAGLISALLSFDSSSLHYGSLEAALLAGIERLGRLVEGPLGPLHRSLVQRRKAVT